MRACWRDDATGRCHGPSSAGRGASAILNDSPGIMTNEISSPPDQRETKPADDEGQLSLWFYVNTVLKRRYLVLFLPAAVALGAAVSRELTPREYVASAKFAPQERGVGETGLGQLATQLGVAGGRTGTNSPQFYADLLLSREILRDVVRSNYQVPERKGFAGDLVAYYKISGSDRDDETSRAVTAVRGRINALADRNGIVQLDFRSDSPTLSLLVVNRLLDLVNDFNLRRRQSQARAERTFVEQRLALSKQELTASEDALAAFVERNRTSQTPMLLAEEQRLRRELNLRQTIFLTLSQSYETAKIEEVRSTPVVTVLEHPDGFVAKQPRKAIETGVLYGVVALILTLIAVFVMEFARRSESEGSASYQEFRQLRTRILGDLRLAKRRSDP
jgi:uncharacterized protein involved in exopolysaccharide biosynthesis